MGDTVWLETAERIGAEQQECNHFVSFSPSSLQTPARGFGWSVGCYLWRQAQGWCDRAEGCDEDACVWTSSSLRATNCQNAPLSAGKKTQYGVGSGRRMGVLSVRAMASEDIWVLLSSKERAYHDRIREEARVDHTRETPERTT